MAKKAAKTDEKIVETPIITPEEAEASAGENSAEETPEQFTKSGKKSKKHTEEVKAEEERQARKIENTADGEPKKRAGAKPTTRPKIERRGKKYQEVAKKVEKGKLYDLKSAIKLALETCPTSFDATLEAHIRLNVDPRLADQNIRGVLVLPNGTGKTIRVAVFAPLDIAKKALAAGADIAEDEDLLTKLDKQQLDFDVLITTPAYMAKLGKYARLLGPKGLMPNPKSGTVTNDIEKAVKEAKAGKVEYRVDKQSIVHIGLGKLSFGTDKLEENTTAFFDGLKSNKPASVKGPFVKSLHLSTTMGPGIPVENTLN